MKTRKSKYYCAYLLTAYILTFSLSVSSNEINPIFVDLYHAYGFDNEAANTVRDLSKSNNIEKIPDVISLQVAKRLYQRGDLAKASSILYKIGQQLPAEMLEEKYLLQTNLLIASKKYQRAYELAKPNGSTPAWAYFAQYNLAIALIKDKQTTKGIQILDQLGMLETDKDDLQALKDQSNLTLGNYFLGADDGNKAIDYFDRIGPGSYYYNKALLGKGWGYTKLFQYSTAIISWNQIQQRDPHSQEAMAALMANPYVLGKMDAFQQAIDQYRKAINIFTQKIYDLSIVFELLQKGTWIDNILQTTSNLSVTETREKIHSTFNEDVQFRPVALNEEFQANMDEYIKLILLQQLLNNTINNVSSYTRKRGSNATATKIYNKTLAAINRSNNRLRLLSENEVKAMALVYLSEKESLRTLKFFSASDDNETSNINRAIILWDIISNNYLKEYGTENDFIARVNQALEILDQKKKKSLSTLNRLAISIINEQQYQIKEFKTDAFLYIAQLSDIEYAMLQEEEQ